MNRLINLLELSKFAAMIRGVVALMRKILVISVLIILFSVPIFVCKSPEMVTSPEVSAPSNLEGASEHCRMWGMVSQTLPPTVVMDQLVNFLDSLKNLGGGPDGPGNVNGWGLIYYDHSGTLFVARGQPEAYADNNFNTAAQALASSGAQVGMGHVRAASSGAVSIPDPHPFVRVYDGKTWTFAHNGGLNIANLKTMIGPTYLAYFTPTVGSSWNDPNVIDSDLYMVYILKCIDGASGNVKAGIAEAETEIYKTDGSSNANFLLSDGSLMWGYKKSVDSSHPLCYKYDASQQYSAIASQPPEGSGSGNWISMSNFNLVEISVGSPPVLYQDMRNYGLQADFTISDNPTTLTISAGGSATSTITVNALNGFIGTVSLQATPSLVSLGAALSPTSITISGTSTLTVTVPTGTIAGSYTVTVTGTSGSLAHSATVNVNVQTPASPLSVTANTDKTSYSRGQTVSIVVSVTSSGLVVSGASIGVKVKSPSGSTSMYSATSGSNGNAVIKIRLSFFAQKGVYTVTASASKAGYQSASTTTSFIMS
jgi:hypothetical protein